MKNMRQLTVFLAVVSLLFFALNTWIGIDIPSEVMDIINLLAGVLVALGILTDTGEEPLPVTKENVMNKLKSPVAVGAIFALF